MKGSQKLKKVSNNHFSFVSIILELCSGGELFDRVLEAGQFSEADASGVLKQVGGALLYMHTVCGVVVSYCHLVRLRLSTETSNQRTSCTPIDRPLHL
jgi:hypothetical protein